MKHLGRLSALGILSAALAGCAQDNEETANITGVAPETEGGQVSYENYMKNQMQKQKAAYAEMPGGTAQ